MNYWLFLIPVIGALVGWLVAFVTLKIALRYIITKRKQAIAEKIGALANTLFSPGDEIKKLTSNQSGMTEIMPVIEQHVDDYLRNKLTKQIPMLSMFIGDKTINTLKKTLLDEIEILFPQVINQYAGSFAKKLDAGQLIVRKINEIPASQLQSNISRSLSKELQLLSICGAITGLITGIILVILNQLI